MKKYFVYMIAVAVMTIAGCKDKEEQTASAPGHVPVTGISLSDHSLEIEAGSKRIITVTLTPGNASKWYVSWTSGDENVVSVDVGRGFCELTARKVGSTTLAATTEDGGYTATCTVNVLSRAQNPVAGVILNPNTTLDLNHLETGRKILMLASVMPANADNKTVIWSSSDESVATISDGLLECTGVGSATITIESDENSAITQSIDIAVTNGDVFIIADFEIDAAGTQYRTFNGTGIAEVADASKLPADAEDIECDPIEGKVLHIHGENVHADYGPTGVQVIPEFVVKLPAGKKLSDYSTLSIDLYFYRGTDNGGTNAAGAGWYGGGMMLSIGFPVGGDELTDLRKPGFGNAAELGTTALRAQGVIGATDNWAVRTWARECQISLTNLPAGYEDLTEFYLRVGNQSGAIKGLMDNVKLIK